MLVFVGEKVRALVADSIPGYIVKRGFHRRFSGNLPVLINNQPDRFVAVINYVDYKPELVHQVLGPRIADFGNLHRFANKVFENDHAGNIQNVLFKNRYRVRIYLLRISCWRLDVRFVREHERADYGQRSNTAGALNQ